MLLLTGALTSKPYAFTSRPWELRSVQSIDTLDGLGSNIRVDFKESEIVRILPRKNFDINESWISDKIRFFYDGLKRQRLGSPYVKIDGNLKALKWNKVLKTFASAIKVFSFEFGPSKIGFISSGSLDTETLYSIKNVTASFGFSNLGLDQPLNFSSDNPSTYTFQSRLQDFENTDHCLLIGTNPRFEASILNLRLRKIYKRGNFKGSSIGGNFHSTFPIDFIGLSSASLLALAEGRHPLCKSLAKAKTPSIICNLGLFSRVDGNAISVLLKSISSAFHDVFKKSLTINPLHTQSNTVGALNLGVSGFKKDNLKDLKLLCAVGIENDKIFSLFEPLSSSSVLVLQSPIGNRYTNLADIVLPTTSFIESDGIYYNTEGRPQKTQRALTGPSLARDNWKIVSALSSYLDKSKLYSTKVQLRSELSKILPSSYFVDGWFTKNHAILASIFDFGHTYAEKLTISYFKLFVEDFFMTHSLCKVSKVMAKASSSLRSYSSNYSFLKSAS